MPDRRPSAARGELTRAQFRRLKRLFDRALQQPEGSIGSFLDSECPDDPVVRAELERLLLSRAADADLSALRDELEGALSPETATLHSTGADPLSMPEQVGPYRIRRLLGEGGMGTVYEAEQSEPIHRHVALKLIRPGLATREVLERFASERRTLARMEHPHIARVLDAGASADGQPYFAMELVDGVDIARFCDRERLTVRRRIELFLPVCRAVHHAHQKGILHRDLKPSNILVEVRDGEPIPKVIDFGIAKATDPRDARSGARTRLGVRIGTPAYMSPEQADPAQQDVDSTTDIYSLGVVLFELLTGSLPFASRAGEGEVTDPDREAPTASARLRASGQSAEKIALRRRTDVAALYRQLRGDIDWILLKAMARDRNRRYASATELAADLERHLHDLPVTAGPPSLVYRVSKFARRHRLAVAVTGLLLAALLLGIAGTTFGLLEARRERATAEREARKAEAINEFLQGMLASPDPNVDGREVRVVDVIERAEGQIADRFADDPEIEIAVRRTLGASLLGLGGYEAAHDHFEEALRLQRELHPDEHPTTAVLLGELSAALYYQGKINAALELERQVLDLKRRIFGPDHYEVLVSLLNLGVFLDEAGETQEAERLERELVERAEAALGEEHELTLTAMSNLSLQLTRMGSLEEAESLNRRTLEIRRRLSGEENAKTLVAMSNLAFVLDQKGEHEEALQLHRRVLEIRRENLGLQHEETLNSMNGVALALLHQGMPAEAKRIYEDLLPVAYDTLGPEHPTALSWRAHYGTCLARLGRLEQAEEQILGAYHELERLLGDRPSRTQAVIEDLVELYEAWGRAIEAEAFRARQTDPSAR